MVMVTVRADGALPQAARGARSARKRSDRQVTPGPGNYLGTSTGSAIDKEMFAKLTKCFPKSCSLWIPRGAGTEPL